MSRRTSGPLRGGEQGLVSGGTREGEGGATGDGLLRAMLATLSVMAERARGRPGARTGGRGGASAARRGDGARGEAEDELAGLRAMLSGSSEGRRARRTRATLEHDARSPASASIDRACDRKHARPRGTQGRKQRKAGAARSRCMGCAKCDRGEGGRVQVGGGGYKCLVARARCYGYSEGAGHGKARSRRLGAASGVGARGT